MESKNITNLKGGIKIKDVKNKRIRVSFIKKVITLIMSTSFYFQESREFI